MWTYLVIVFNSKEYILLNTCFTDLKIVTTSDGSAPTPANSSPLQGVEGRGSIVLFNQASMFQLAELGSTVSDAKLRGKVATCDNQPYIDSLPQPCT